MKRKTILSVPRDNETERKLSIARQHEFHIKVRHMANGVAFARIGRAEAELLKDARRLLLYQGMDLSQRHDFRLYGLRLALWADDPSPSEMELALERRWSVKEIHKLFRAALYSRRSDQYLADKYPHTFAFLTSWFRSAATVANLMPYKKCRPTPIQPPNWPSHSLGGLKLCCCNDPAGIRCPVHES